MTDEKTAPAGGSERMSEEEFERAIRESGKIPVQTFLVFTEARRARESEEILRFSLEESGRVRAEIARQQKAAKDAEIAALRERAEGTERREDALVAKLENYTAKIQTAEADRDRLREIIRNAPHGTECPMWTEYRMESGYDERCDCWKAAALREEK